MSSPRKKPVKKRASQASGQAAFKWKGFLLKLSVVLLVMLVAAAAWLDALVRERFDGHKWRVPARVYAQPVELYQGREIQPRHLQRLLGLMRYEKRTVASQPGTFSRSGNEWDVYLRGFNLGSDRQASRFLQLRLQQGRIAYLKDNSGNDVPLAQLEPLVIGSIHPGQEEDRILVQLEQVPPLLLKMLLATEDRDFHQHMGISLRGLVRALLVNLKAGGVRQGASTLTQQLVKNFWLTPERTVSRKLLEMAMALLLELHYSKEHILQAYLNEVYLGQDGARAIHGIGLASRYYFGRPVEALHPAQMAMLVGMLKGPSAYDPRRHPQRARERRNLVLKIASETGVISEQQRQQYAVKPLNVVSKDATALYAFPAFLDLVRRQLSRDYSLESLSSEGLQIFSTLDVLAQLQAEYSLQQFLRKKADGKLNGAVVISAPARGDVLALVGDAHPRTAGFNRALDAVRPIGSLVKPAVLLTALQQPGKYSLATRIEDGPVEVSMPDGRLWAPENFDHQSLGAMPLLDVLVQSRNQATARLGLDLGVTQVISTLQKMGMQRDVPAYPSVLLGSVELSPFEVAVLYQTLATGGFRMPLRSITDVFAADGGTLGRYPVSPQPAFSPGQVYQVRWAMEQVMQRGTGRSASWWLAEDLAVAGKTGTSDGLRDSWFAGFSADHLAVVWIGRDDNQSTGLTGSSGALPVWADIMGNLGNHSLPAALPEELQWVWLDASGSKVSGALCEGARRYPLPTDSIPVQQDSCGKAASISGEVKRKVKKWWQKLFGE